MVQIDKIEFILLKHLNIYAYSSILLVKYLNNFALSANIGSFL